MAIEEPIVGKYEAIDINEHIDRLLRDLGYPEPPLRLEQVRDLQRLDLTYYAKSDLDLLDEMAHQATMAGAVIQSDAQTMLDVVNQADLKGLLLLDDDKKKIYIDQEVVELKRRFIIAHEITHDLLPWHRSLLLCDNESTLSPSCHRTIEAEANYGGRRLIFMGKKFQEDARSLEFNWKTIEVLKRRFGNTLTTTLWQMICEREPSHPAFGMISRHPYYPEIGKSSNGASVSHFIRSDGFRSQFGNVQETEAFEEMASYATRRKRGPVGGDIRVFTDVNGDRFDFEMFTFSNTHMLLTYGHCVGPHRLVMDVKS